MMSNRFWVWVIFWIVLIGVLIGGVGYLRHEVRQRRIQEDLQLTRNLMNQEDWATADALLKPLMVPDHEDAPWYPQAQVMQLEILVHHDLEAAQAMARTMLSPESEVKDPAKARAHGLLGQAALEAEQAQTAKEHFEALLELAGPTAPGADQARLGLARIRMATTGVSKEVRDELQALREAFPDSPLRPEIEYALGQCNLHLLKSPIPTEGDQIYSIQRGDTIYELAKDHGLSQELLMAVNGITDARMLSIGRRIKIPDVDFSIVVDKSTNTLTLLNHGEFFARYPVRTGRIDYLTPVGDFKIVTKKKNPQWTDPKTHQTYAPLHPDNELGTRWMGFQGSSLGIHGTIHPESIGSYASNGCVGMLKEDVEELYDLVRVGTPITIKGEIQASGDEAA